MVNAIGYGCTSGATIIGEDRVAKIIAKAHPGVPSTNPLTAAKAAFPALGVSRLGLLTPYTPDVTEAMQARFEAAGITVKVAEISRIPSTTVKVAGKKTDQLLRLLEALDDHDDIQKVYSNADFDADELAKLD